MCSSLGSMVAQAVGIYQHEDWVLSGEKDPEKKLAQSTPFFLLENLLDENLVHLPTVL